jgi:flagellin
MSSIMTNVSAMTALQTLKSTSQQLNVTQQRISTGYRVSSAEDNAAYWSIATTMRSDNSALSTVKDALGLGSATVDVAYTAMNKAIDVVSEIKTKLVAARQPGVDRTKVQSEISELQNQLKSVADSSVFSSENWLSIDSSAASFNATKSVVSSFSRSGGAISIGTISINISSTPARAARRSASSMRCATGPAPSPWRAPIRSPASASRRSPTRPPI